MNHRKSCLVIGGQGFIGSHLLPALLKSGKNVISLNRHEVNDSHQVDGITHITGDYSNSDLLESLLQKSDEVIHLAYATQPNTSFLDPFSDLSQNVPATLQLFKLAAQYHVRMVFVSSGGTVYGEACSIPQTEDHPTRPISPYGVTKLTLEKYAYLYATIYNLNIIIARPSNPYGEGQRPFAGQGFIPTAMALAYQGKSLTIYGQTGTVRDYIYISDVVSGLITILNHGEKGEIYNIGSGIGLNNLQVTELIQESLQIDDIILDINHTEKRPFDVENNILDSQKLKKIGWQPSVTMNEGLEKTKKWLKKYLQTIT
ncbi:MAG: NAD-dependent epimerase/dehydratase family protein [Mariprofundaceae bacterium]|nr:NAD-dependent epimerase/dehydratase family protein [Mariprofundaceae bacterium]